MSLEAFPLNLSRSAFSPAETARSGDLWRLLQDAAVVGSSRRGWPPERYREERCGFVVRKLTAVHHRQPPSGRPLQVRTWVSSFKRGVISDRQIRVEADGVAVSSAAQTWVHVGLPDLAMRRAAPALLEAFAIVAGDGADVRLPAWVSADGRPHELQVPTWHTWMDSLGHANHPAYVEWCDEALHRALATAGVDATGLVADGEELTFRSGAVAPEEVTASVRLVGQTDRGVALEAVVRGADGRVCAEGTLLRSLPGVGAGALAAVL